jgi:hypothetical protein
MRSRSVGQRVLSLFAAPRAQRGQFTVVREIPRPCFVVGAVRCHRFGNSDRVQLATGKLACQRDAGMRDEG